MTNIHAVSFPIPCRRSSRRFGTAFLMGLALMTSGCLSMMSRFTGDESERHDPRELLSDYHYRYQFVTASELSHIMAESPDPVFVFDFVRSSSDKFVAVYERKAGLVFREYHSASYNIDSGDFSWF